IRIWQSDSAKLALPPIQTTDYDGGALSLSWTPDGNQIIAACLDYSIRIFDASNGTQIAQWKAHTNYIRSIAISCDGRFIASGSADKTVKLWDTATHQQLDHALQHDNEVNTVCISPDAKYIASAGYDKKVSLW
ncbi:hypothetical protein HYDPIDRAFT_63841, partial [Hydnomerulius pinastri MD-312]